MVDHREEVLWWVTSKAASPRIGQKDRYFPKGHLRKTTVEYVPAWVFTANASAQSQVAILRRLWYT